MIELDLEIHLEAIKWIEARPLVAIFDAHTFLDAHETFGRALLFEPGGLKEEHERAGAAIHDGHLRRAHLDKGIVDAETRERR